MEQNRQPLENRAGSNMMFTSSTLVCTALNHICHNRPHYMPAALSHRVSQAKGRLQGGAGAVVGVVHLKLCSKQLSDE